ncbi:hypothetical protein EDC96DRAFT_549408 [Choanephora cucurbitarum]|nr:hypothetical protein EDC96DRAFT_549408 [Choanephora cucurbitarum]
MASSIHQTKAFVAWTATSVCMHMRASYIDAWSDDECAWGHILPTSKTLQGYYGDDNKERLLSDTRCMNKIDKQTVSLSNVKSCPNHFMYLFHTEQSYLLCHFWVSSILHFAASPEGSL